MVALTRLEGVIDQRFTLDTPRAVRTNLFIKSCLDGMFAAIGLVILLPLLAMISLAVCLDGGPVLYAHPRVGKNGKIFHCLKFRSMAVNADVMLAELLVRDAAAARAWADTQKLKNDVRVTKVGRFLRATSLDELPQLFNVLRQDMSLVGPRPIVQQEVPRYSERIAYYYGTRPGLTGLWQISGRSDTSYAQRVELDTWYVQNWSLRLDMVILAKTLPAVLKRSGAC